MTTRPFASLTARGRQRRLRRVAERALEAWDLEVLRIRRIGGFVNVQFRVDTPNGPYALRVDQLEEHSEADTRIELAWLEALARDGLPVPVPQPTRTGELYVWAEAPGVPRARRCSLFSWIPGRPIEGFQTPRIFERYGALCARLQRHGRTFVPPETPMCWDRPFYFPEAQSPVVWDHPEHDALFGPGDRDVVARAIDRIGQALADIDPADRQVVHGDLHLWNVHVSRGRVYALDFEDVMLATPTQDIAIVLSYLDARKDPSDPASVAHHDALVAAFQRGYATIAPWPGDPERIATYIEARRLMSVNFLLTAHPELARAWMPKALTRLKAWLER